MKKLFRKVSKSRKKPAEEGDDTEDPGQEAVQQLSADVGVHEKGLSEKAKKQSLSPFKKKKNGTASNASLNSEYVDAQENLQEQTPLGQNPKDDILVASKTYVPLAQSMSFQKEVTRDSAEIGALREELMLKQIQINQAQSVIKIRTDQRNTAQEALRRMEEEVNKMASELRKQNLKQKELYEAELQAGKDKFDALQKDFEKVQAELFRANDELKANDHALKETLVENKELIENSKISNASNKAKLTAFNITETFGEQGSAINLNTNSEMIEISKELTEAQDHSKLLLESQDEIKALEKAGREQAQTIESLRKENEQLQVQMAKLKSEGIVRVGDDHFEELTKRFENDRQILEANLAGTLAKLYANEEQLKKMKEMKETTENRLAQVEAIMKSQEESLAVIADENNVAAKEKAELELNVSRLTELETTIVPKLELRIKELTEETSIIPSLRYYETQFYQAMNEKSLLVKDIKELQKELSKLGDDNNKLMELKSASLLLELERCQVLSLQAQFEQVKEQKTAAEQRISDINSKLGIFEADLLFAKRENSKLKLETDNLRALVEKGNAEKLQFETLCKELQSSIQTFKSQQSDEICALRKDYDEEYQKKSISLIEQLAVATEQIAYLKQEISHIPELKRQLMESSDKLNELTGRHSVDKLAKVLEDLTASNKKIEDLQKNLVLSQTKVTNLENEKSLLLNQSQSDLAGAAINIRNLESKYMEDLKRKELELNALISNLEQSKQSSALDYDLKNQLELSEAQWKKSQDAVSAVTSQLKDIKLQNSEHEATIKSLISRLEAQSSESRNKLLLKDSLINEVESKEATNASHISTLIKENESLQRKVHELLILNHGIPALNDKVKALSNQLSQNALANNFARHPSVSQTTAAKNSKAGHQITEDQTSVGPQDKSSIIASSEIADRKTIKEVDRLAAKQVDPYDSSFQARQVPEGYANYENRLHDVTINSDNFKSGLNIKISGSHLIVDDAATVTESTTQNRKLQDSTPVHDAMTAVDGSLKSPALTITQLQVSRATLLTDCYYALQWTPTLDTVTVNKGVFYNKVFSISSAWRMPLLYYHSLSFYFPYRSFCAHKQIPHASGRL